MGAGGRMGLCSVSPRGFALCTLCALSRTVGVEVGLLIGKSHGLSSAPSELKEVQCHIVLDGQLLYADFISCAKLGKTF